MISYLYSPHLPHVMKLNVMARCLEIDMKINFQFKLIWTKGSQWLTLTLSSFLATFFLIFKNHIGWLVQNMVICSSCQFFKLRKGLLQLLLLAAHCCFNYDNQKFITGRRINGAKCESGLLLPGTYTPYWLIHHTPGKEGGRARKKADEEDEPPPNNNNNNNTGKFSLKISQNKTKNEEKKTPHTTTNVRCNHKQKQKRGTRGPHRGRGEPGGTGGGESYYRFFVGLFWWWIMPLGRCEEFFFFSNAPRTPPPIHIAPGSHEFCVTLFTLFFIFVAVSSQQSSVRFGFFFFFVGYAIYKIINSIDRKEKKIEWWPLILYRYISHIICPIPTPLPEVTICVWALWRFYLLSFFFLHT